MGSRKRSARQRQIRALKEELSARQDGLSDAFALADQRRRDLEGRRESALRERACDSKQRYPSRQDAEEAIVRCEARGRRGLSCYRCEWCNGWHLTSHPRR